MNSPKEKSIRPYTSYNLFFQLEREYILQTLHGYRPNIDPGNTFNPNNGLNYSGPPLPSRYANLTLPYDWHIPGKTRRRKRSHRRSHGKVGFHELNEQISKSWSTVDDGIKNFCAQLSDIDGKKYKKIKKMKKKMKVTKKMSKSEKKKNDGCKNDMIASFDWAPSNSPGDQPSLVSIRRTFSKFERIVSRESFPDEQDCNTLETISTEDSNSFRDSLTEIDMEDDEILELWHSIPIGEDDGAASFCQVCTESPEPPYDKEEQDAQVNNQRLSFIDEEYERFKEIGKHFKTRSGIPGKLEINTYMARQA